MPTSNPPYDFTPGIATPNKDAAAYRCRRCGTPIELTALEWMSGAARRAFMAHVCPAGPVADR